MRGARVALLAVAGSAMACGDPVAETWRSTYETAGKHDEFTLDGDLVGQGKFYFPELGGDGVLGCSGDVEAREDGDGGYTLDVAFGGGGACRDQEAAHLFCTLREDDTQLFCGPSLIFEAVDE